MLDVITGEDRYRVLSQKRKLVREGAETLEALTDDMMKFEVEFCSTQQYLPSQRHKKLRCRCENHFFDVEVSEVRNDEFPVAFIVSSEGNGRSEIRIRDKNLNQKVIRGQKTLSEMVNHKLTNIDSPSNYLMRKLAALGKLESDFTENSVIVADDAEEQKRLICEQAKDYIIFKGNLWERCDEPGYYVTLFPYGSIHFGIAVDSRFRSGRFFNAFEKEQVVAYAKQILQENIHEHNDVDKYLEERASCCEIQVLMPEMVTKCHEFLSKQDFLQKCKSIVRGEITEFGGELEGVSVDVVNEGGQLAMKSPRPCGAELLWTWYRSGAALRSNHVRRLYRWL